MRKFPLVTGQVHHVFTKSIAGFKIFNNSPEFSRMTCLMKYYRQEKPAVKFSQFIKPFKDKKDELNTYIPSFDNKRIIEIIAYCIMPTHLHFLLKQVKENGISIYMRKILDSYTKYFNTKLNRKGPLWEGRFKNVFVKTDEQLLHLTRYIHLNPTTAYLVDKPQEWAASSYQEYILKSNDGICKYDDVLDVEPLSYKKFTDDRISYQRELAKIKELLLEE